MGHAREQIIEADRLDFDAHAGGATRSESIR
jgi:hypothetical protein